MVQVENLGWMRNKARVCRAAGCQWKEGRVSGAVPHPRLLILRGNQRVLCYSSRFSRSGQPLDWGRKSRSPGMVGTEAKCSEPLGVLCPGHLSRLTTPLTKPLSHFLAVTAARLSSQKKDKRKHSSYWPLSSNLKSAWLSPLWQGLWHYEWLPPWVSTPALRMTFINDRLRREEQVCSTHS